MELQHSEVINKITKSHKAEIDEIKSTLNRKESEYESKTNALESEVRQFKEKIVFEQQNKVGSQASTERKLRELTENDKRMTSEIEKLKTEKLNQKNEF